MDPTSTDYLNQWTKSNPLCLTRKSDVFKKISDHTAKLDVYLKCPCSDKPFKYKGLTQHKKSATHISHTNEQGPIVDKAKGKSAWYSRNDIITLINDTKKAADTPFNAAKIQRLEYVRDHGLNLCKCGSAYKHKNKTHLETDIHKNWVSYGSPLYRVVYRVRGFTDLRPTE